MWCFEVGGGFRGGFGVLVEFCWGFVERGLVWERSSLNFDFQLFFATYILIHPDALATRAQFHGSAYRRIMRLRSQFPAYVQVPNFCASLVSV